MISENTKKILEKIKNRTPKEEEISRIKYCIEAIKDKKFRLVKWKSSQKDWTHDHCDFCGKHISDKKGSENKAYTNSKDDWFCKECFKKYKKELGLKEVIK